jgi:D-alanyl-lipoteichoic acid acyltransferase DltB (MBOAT superfamily)
MLFNTPLYIFLFLPITVLVYFSLNRARLTTGGKAWLVLASLFFYGYWNPSYLLLIIGSVLVNYSIGRSLQRYQRQTGPRGPSRKALLAVGVLINLGLLAYFKYTDFILVNAAWIVGIEATPLEIILPLAISFFTFQQIAYLVDCYQTDTQEYDFLNYCMFVTFFPQLIAGPIVHHSEMMPQFMRKRNLVTHWGNIALGIAIFSLGLFKKVVIADSFSIWANAGFDSHGVIRIYDAWATSLSYSFQLYYDFSGYTDMAIGAALLFNIRLPVNFNSPYRATDIQDFWRRWHMTLSRWLRDYVYIPLGGSRLGESRTLVNIFATFLLGGLWHGAAWTFVIWGAMHGGALIAHRLWKNAGLRMPAILGWFVTFMFVNITWIFFRAETFPDAMRILGAMFKLPDRLIFTHKYTETINSQNLFGFLQDGPGQLGPAIWLPLIAFALAAFLLPNSVQRAGFVPAQPRHHFRADWGHSVIVAVLLFLSILTFLGETAPSEFLYFNF